ncbi:MAG: TlpA family protein disulfide reductase [Bacteroidales bacterium]|nr:TlpA family protein disulfide reductase [Bacteroidales bacterium]
MKARLYILALVTILMAACTPKVSEITRINGRIEDGSADQVTVFVLDYNIQNEQIEVTDGTFSYELATNPAVVATFTCYVDGKRVSQALIPDGSELQLVFSSDGASLTSSNKKSINYRYLEVDRVYKEMSDFASQYMALQRAGAPKEQLDSMAELRRPVSEKLQTLYREDLEKHKDNYLSVRGLTGLQGELTDEQKDSLIHTLDSTVIQTARIQMVLKDIQGRLRSKEGMPFVDFSIDAEDVTVQLSDFVGNGKYVLADFWASWCQPCIVEMPHLKELYKKYKGSEFTILGIAVSDNIADSRKAIRELELPWDQILGTGDIAMNAYGINSIPHIILFGPDGTILRRDLRGEEIDRALEGFIKLN